MYKLNTQLAFFKFNTIIQKDKFYLSWFVLEVVDNQDLMGRGFNQNELDTFIKFVINKPINFPNGKDRFECKESDLPYCGHFSLAPSQSLSFPNNLIIRKHPRLSSEGKIYDCMDIILTNDRGRNNHTYNLDFDVVGRVHNR